MLRDIRYSVRTLIKRPGFSLVIVATLALGIGANAAFFSIVNGVLLRPLPYTDPDQLVTVHQSKQNFETGAIPYPNFLDMQRENRTFQAMAIFRPAGFTLAGTEPERVRGRMISADFFNVLDVKPVLGRTFTADDDKKGAELTAIITTSLWNRRFSASKDIINQNITLDDKSYRVVGVLPASFNFFSSGPDVFVTIGAWGAPVLQNRGVALGIHGIGRLKAGVTIDQAQADLDRVMRDLAVAYPATNKDNGAKLVRLRSIVVGDVQPILLMLLAAVGLVLLISCANVSNLMLAHSTGKAREFAIRAALGASRLRLLRQSLIESIVLALAGGTAGLLIAAWGTQVALRALPTALPRAAEVKLDFRVLLFTLGISLLTGLLAGLAPALKTSQSRSSETLKEGGRGSAARGRAQGLLVAMEMAIALVLLIGAGLLIRSLNAVWNVDPGFQPDNMLTLAVNFPPAMGNANANTTRATLRDLSDKLSNTPGVAAASLTSGATPLIGEDDLYFWVEGEPKPSTTSDMHMALYYVVEPGYLQAMGMKLIRGRFFTNQDDERAPRVAVIDEILARQRFGNQDPLGHRIIFDQQQGSFEIVGVVGHIKQWGLDSDQGEQLQAQLYVPMRALPDQQVAGTANVSAVVRSNTGSKDITPAFVSSIRQTVNSHGNQNVISNMQTMNEVIAGSLAQRRFSMILLGSFAGVALLLASLGIYGVISYLVGQRIHELGIRVALGASRRDILRLVLGNGMKMTLLGVAIGLVAAFALTRLMAAMLFGVSATDPLTFGSIALLLVVVALLACYMPARRATKVDPLVALRYE
jgi:predicted permease